NIGTNWGIGNGTTTFNLPDLRGRALIGSGAGPGLTTRILAQIGGLENVGLVMGQLPAGMIGTIGGFIIPGSNWTGVTPDQPIARSGQSNDFDIEFDDIQVNSNGQDQAHNNMQPFAVVNFIIKT